MRPPHSECSVDIGPAPLALTIDALDKVWFAELGLISDTSFIGKFDPITRLFDIHSLRENDANFLGISAIGESLFTVTTNRQLLSVTETSLTVSMLPGEFKGGAPAGIANTFTSTRRMSWFALPDDGLIYEMDSSGSVRLLDTSFVGPIALLYDDGYLVVLDLPARSLGRF